jgi:hypothetical protein
MEVPENVIQWALGILLQGHPGFDATALILGAALLLLGERKSFGRVVLAIGLVLLFGGHLMIHITVPGGPS